MDVQLNNSDNNLANSIGIAFLEECDRVAKLIMKIKKLTVGSNRARRDFRIKNSNNGTHKFFYYKKVLVAKVKIKRVFTDGVVTDYEIETDTIDKVIEREYLAAYGTEVREVDQP